MRPKPISKIRVNDERGFAYLPKLLREELEVKGKADIPAYIGANVVLLVRRDTNLEDILKGLEILKIDLQLRKR